MSTKSAQPTMHIATHGAKRILLALLCCALMLAQGLWRAPQAEAKSLVLPSAYYLTNEGFVTPVKLQSPWGSCWAFAVASAIESSILKAEDDALTLARKAFNSKGHDAPQLSNLNDSVDLSERAIAWLSHEAQSEEVAGAQAGEGYHLVNPDDPMAQLPEGSFSMVEAALTSWQLLVPEELAPYEYNGYTGSNPWYSTGSVGPDARYNDWSVDAALMASEEVEWRVSDIVHLESPADLSLNPGTATYDYLGFNEDAVIGIKQALLDIGAVAISLEAELSIPSQVVRHESSTPSEHFSYDTWAQYNGKSVVAPNHALTIVGWDDAFPASSFQGTASGSPPGDGAWLCKNNWGSDALYRELGGSADATHWGIPTEDAGSSGFFWLSYYDHTITDVTAFEVESIVGSVDNVYQLDYLSAAEYLVPTSYTSAVKVANVFTAEKTELLDSVSAWTFVGGENVATEIYVLPPESESLEDEALGAATFFTTEYLAQSFTTTFEDAGFHRVELESPVIVPEGQRFAVVQCVQGVRTDDDGSPIEDAYYLSLELAYTQNDENHPQSAMADVVANEGETYVLLFGNDWAPVSSYNEWYADLKNQGNVPVDVIYGNALIKAYTNDTTMTENQIIYQTVPLGS